MEIIKAIHVMIGVSFLGLIVASFFYISYSLQQNNLKLIKYALKASLLLDAFVVAFILWQFASAHYLVKANHFSLAIPWIKVAYIALSLLTVIWLIIVAIKWYNYRHLTIMQPEFYLRRIFYGLNIILIVIFTIIIHDAVMQQTFTWVH